MMHTDRTKGKPDAGAYMALLQEAVPNPKQPESLSSLREDSRSTLTVLDLCSCGARHLVCGDQRLCAASHTRPYLTKAELRSPI